MLVIDFQDEYWTAYSVQGSDSVLYFTASANSYRNPLTPLCINSVDIAIGLCLKDIKLNGEWAKFHIFKKMREI